jgi:hypothetical protein
VAASPTTTLKRNVQKSLRAITGRMRVIVSRPDVENVVNPPKMPTNTTCAIRAHRETRSRDHTGQHTDSAASDDVDNHGCERKSQ